MSGLIDDLKGKAKEATGKVTGDQEQEAKGKVDQIVGDVKDKIDDVKDKAGEKVNEVLDKVKGKTDDE